jgi:hypothetical protein
MRGRPPIEMVGRTFGTLTVLRLLPERRYGRRFFECRCTCGRLTAVVGVDLRTGNTKSCGCQRGPASRERILTAKIHPGHKHGAATKGMSPTYQSWANMKQRCMNPAIKCWHHYGGRGIKVCERWRARTGFVNFLADMGERPEGKTLDRRDNEGNYSCGHCAECMANGWPANCRWATRSEQQFNRRRPSAIA